MSASDVRRGPGWWMDLDGDWNPPETWPERTPPLPGWRLSELGHWEPPAAADGSLRELTEADTARLESSTVNGDGSERARVSLTYADRSAASRTPVIQYRGPSIRSAVLAALAAAVIATMIATGLIVLGSML